MRQIHFHPTFSIWQQFARSALQLHWLPNELIWKEEADEQSELSLFNNANLLKEIDAKTKFLVPRDFILIAKRVACYQPSPWSLLYHILWRLTHGEPHLLKISTDPLIRELEEKDKAVRREIHKMRAFIRFKEVILSELSQPWFVAWFEPKHHILEMNANFFMGRFTSMFWSILTPYRCMHWDQQQLLFTPGVSQPSELNDKVEKLWKTYYANIFNPARIKIKAMQKEMPLYYWKNLPETSIISQLLQKAHPRVNKMMLKSQVKTTSEFTIAPVPNSSNWSVIKKSAETCRACPLWRNTTQTVFGEGTHPARIMLVGEQPGDQEDIQGRPFVGPAGQLLARFGTS